MSDVTKELEGFAKLAECGLQITVDEKGTWSIGERGWSGYGVVTLVESNSLEDAYRKLVRNALGKLEADAIRNEELNAEFEQKRASFRALAKKL